MVEPRRSEAQAGDARVRTRSEFAACLIAGRARFSRDARGSTAIEYALIGSLIFLVAAGSLRFYASRMNGVYTQINTAVTQSN